MSGEEIRGDENHGRIANEREVADHAFAGGAGLSYKKIQTAGIIIVLVFLFIRVFALSGSDDTLISSIVNYSFLGLMVLVFALLFIFRYRP